MPYIPQERRKQFDEVGKSGHHPKLDVPGELAYELTLKIVKYLKYHGRSFTTISDILGALEATKLEFNRRVIVPYEDDKRAQNGDVY